MNSSFDRAKKQWTLMRETARELGMRGDILREIVGFPGIIARHACKVDRQEFRRLMAKDDYNPFEDPKLVAALARKDPGFEAEFAAAERKRFDRCDRPSLDRFGERVKVIVDEAIRFGDTTYSLHAIEELKELSARIPEPAPGFGPRWRKEGLELVVRAIAEVREGIGKHAAAARSQPAVVIVEGGKRRAAAHGGEGYVRSGLVIPRETLPPGVVDGLNEDEMKLLNALRLARNGRWRSLDRIAKEDYGGGVNGATVGNWAKALSRKNGYVRALLAARKRKAAPDRWSFRPRPGKEETDEEAVKAITSESAHDLKEIASDGSMSVREDAKGLRQFGKFSEFVRDRE